MQQMATLTKEIDLSQGLICLHFHPQQHIAHNMKRIDTIPKSMSQGIKINFLIKCVMKNLKVFNSMHWDKNSVHEL